MRTTDPLRRWWPCAAVAGIALAVGGLLAPPQPAEAEVEAVTLRLEEAHCAS